ncbi:LuxR family transcriptional regulator [Paraburkholderia sp. RL18-103-BIB-C]|uniref:LuxR family transcriptional regulator n=1 Tax=Paraburkholderia sp. RL18-103-BIB-C TaxID=3031637 RepID=UPI0038BD099C
MAELLGDRERLVLERLATGMTSKEIARALGISDRTVSKHRENIKRKVGVRDLAGLIQLVRATSS